MNDTQIRETIIQLSDCLCATKIDDQDSSKLWIIANVSHGRLPERGRKIESTKDIVVMNGICKLWHNDGVWYVEESSYQTMPVTEFESKAVAIDYIKNGIQEYWINKNQRNA